MGMMEYNNDWKAIKQRFLPCKSEHQIFVRAKNRCSSKAPDNPIKAVRKMKTSLLTDEEKARIHEGLKTFKLDWMAIWKFIVPYRDPNLLCRQWRIANGTQKSYKADADKKKQRRLYESNRRKIKAAAMENFPTESEKEDDPTEYSGGRTGGGEDCVENDNEAYLHEAFMSDWRPSSSGTFASQIPALSSKTRCTPGYSAKSIPNPVVSEAHLHSHRSQKRSVPNVVKLAPELPPVKLPSAVRVIPQALLRTSQGTVKTVNPTASIIPSQRCELVNNGCPTKEGSRDLDPQMHPLLFQTLEDGRFPYYPISTRIPTFSFFLVQNQMNVVNLLQNPSPASPISARPKSFGSKRTAPNSSNLDFHPLLQGPSDAVNSGAMSTIDPMLSTDLELSRDGFTGYDLVNEAGATADQMANTSGPTTRTDAVDLNLDIHLDSTLRKRKVPSYEGTEKYLTACMEKSGSVSLAAMVPNRDGSSVACTNDDVGDMSLSGIVMEQEELSDSDEESEIVEFECEEMTDSEEEARSDNGHIVNAQNENQERSDPRKGSVTSPWLSLNSVDTSHMKEFQPNHLHVDIAKGNI